MTILLINPPRSSVNGILQYASDDARKFVHKKLIGPPLGLLTIASAVDDIADVAFLDAKGEYDLDPFAPELDELVAGYVKEYEPDILGVTFIASEFDSGIEIFQAAKKVNPDIVTVAGGVHATLCPDHFADTPTDIIVPGHAGHIFRDIVTALDKGKSPESVPGIILNKPAGQEKTAPRTDEWDPAKKNYIQPDRDYLDRWHKTYLVGPTTIPSTYLFTSLGCEHRCTFCSIWPQCKGTYSTRDVESVIEELKTCTQYASVRFADANSIGDLDFVNTLFDRIIEEGLESVYVMDIRADTIVEHPELIEKCAKGGLKVVICGFESYKQDELEKYNKSADAKMIHNAIDILHSHDIWIRGNYVVPCNYTRDDFQAMTDYANSHKVAYAGYTVLTPIPGTVYYNQMKDQIIDHDLKKYNFFNAVLPTSMPLEEYYKNMADLWLIKRGEDVI